MRKAVLILVLCAWAWGSSDVADGMPRAEQTGTAGEPEHVAPGAGETGAAANQDDDRQKRQYRLALIVMAAGLAVLFGFLLLITLVRVTRYQRQRLKIGRKDQATEYFDAWSHYRLKENGSPPPGGDAEDDG